MESETRLEIEARPVIREIRDVLDKQSDLALILLRRECLGRTPEDRSLALGHIHFICQQSFYAELQAIAEARLLLDPGYRDPEITSDPDKRAEQGELERAYGDEPWFEAVGIVLGEGEDVVRRHAFAVEASESPAEHIDFLWSMAIMVRMSFYQLGALIDGARHALCYEALGPEDLAEPH